MLKSIYFWIEIKQWPLAPNSRKWRITRANVSNASHIFPEMTFGECRRVWRVWRVHHSILANLKLGRFMYKKKIFLGIKRSSLSSPNSPDSPNSPERVTKICSILAKFAGASHKNLANFWQVLEFAKFAGEWPLLNRDPNCQEMAKFTGLNHRDQKYFWSLWSQQIFHLDQDFRV